MRSISRSPKPCKKGVLVYGFRICIRWPSVQPYPDFHNRVLFQADTPAPWTALEENPNIVRASLFKRGRLIAEFNRDWPEHYQAVARKQRKAA